MEIDAPVGVWTMTVKDAIRLLDEARILERAAIENLEMAKSTVRQAEDDLKEARKQRPASRHALMVLACLVAVPAWAQNPCTVPLQHQILQSSGANQFWAELPDHTATRPDGSAVTLSYQYGAWLDGQNPNTTPPTQGPSTIPKSGFVLVAGFANCYKLTGGLPALMPTEARMIAGLRSVGAGGSSGWVASDSFSLASTPVIPAAPGQVRIRP